MAFNYSMNGINRADAPKAVEIMKKAVEILSTAKIDQNSRFYQKIRGIVAIHTSRLAGIYNALGKYDLALETASDAEKIVKESPTDSNIIYANGIIARERGLAHLRLNKLQEAYDYFMEAKRIFSRASIGAYLFRLKMHEAESLIRLNRLEEAWAACESMFSTKDRERNNYCDLFFNTCYYHAAVIKYRQKNVGAAKEYFAKFFASMLVLCKNILPKEKFDKLVRQNAFEENPRDIKTCFENSLKVFEAIYWKDYEFTKYYVEENLHGVACARP
jgi:tetratricopeptide (TPR) repeat protein